MNVTSLRIDNVTGTMRVDREHGEWEGGGRGGVASINERNLNPLPI